MTDHDLSRFGLRYRHFLRLARGISYLPPSWRLAGARTLGRHASPYRERADILCPAMSEALALDPVQTGTAWHAWLENHGLAAVTVFAYKGLASGWLGDLIRVTDAGVLTDLAKSRGLVLTAHCQHQNVIAAYLGHTCGSMHPLAGSASASPLYPWIGKYIERINHDSAVWFKGGRYLFIEERHAAVRATLAALDTGACVLALCDSHVQDAKPEANGKLFGRAFTPPSGVIKAALRLGTPIHAALMTPEPDGLALHLAPLPTSGGLTGVLSAYCAFLESRLRTCPAAWQGWEWWSGLPRPE